MIGGVALVMFAVIFFRLWYLQVLSGDNYVAAARENRVREIKVQAPRGEIVDRHGQQLVENRNSLSIKFTPDKLPETRAEREEVYRRLAKLLGLNPRRLERRVEARAEGAAVREADGQAGRGLEPRDVPARAPGGLPGRRARARVPARVPARQVGAHLFGQVGEVSPRS